jgi:hypothetical protein
MLGEKKGYAFVGANSAGNNAYFIRKDKIGTIRPCSVQDGYVKSRYRESRDTDGNLSFLSEETQLKVIEDMPVYDLEKGCVVKIKDLDRR